MKTQFGRDDSLIAEAAEVRKKQFVRLVQQLAGLRDLQYDNDFAPKVITSAENVPALNLPSNLIRASAIFVDWFYGFPANKSTFQAPKWVISKEVLPEDERGSLCCGHFYEVVSLEQNDVVVLLRDVPEHGLHAGMAGILRELPSDDDDMGEIYLVEFGEPQDCNSKQVEIPASWLRGPRPGDLIENYRL